MTKLQVMKNLKNSSKVHSLIKTTLSMAILPIFLIYMMVGKPDYYIMNSLSHIVLPVANVIGDIIIWPIKMVGSAFNGLSSISELRSENEELHVRLDEALKKQHDYEIALLENQKLSQELDIVKNNPIRSILADVIHDNTAFHHSSFLINRGDNDGIETGMVVTSLDGSLVGITTDIADNFSRVRSLRDSNTSIAVRVAGSEVYGFLNGTGSSTPKMGFFSDPKFQPMAGIKLITTNISGVLPSGIFVGTMIDDTNVEVVQSTNISRVVVLMFDNKNRYK